MSGLTTYGKARARLLQLLAEESYRYDPVHKFQLAFGELSTEYLDCKRTTFRADALPLVGHVLYNMLQHRAGRYGIQACGGLTQGADPLALAVAYFSADQARQIYAFSVRRSAKGHGSTRRIEGPVQPGDRVFVLDDVITTGTSTIQAIEACRDFGLNVVGVLALVNRDEQNGLEHIRSVLGEKKPVAWIYTRQEIAYIIEGKQNADTRIV